MLRNNSIGENFQIVPTLPPSLRPRLAEVLDHIKTALSSELFGSTFADVLPQPDSGCKLVAKLDAIEE
ncbi:hypothetical protein GWI33_019850 [Rhynchophorus ferrugineus]|uniref:Uncharacterized protein n=1 Tax=Rhynchophorus ferrugineus TaxID=354439 RepID=A0A834M6L2_RHYFE|nr:hypothetical protein GWI33_019850 [Rhynchophorus ferrugineus]